MTLKTAFAALMLSLAPMIASAACPGHQAMSCADGMVWDHETGNCIKQVSS